MALILQNEALTLPSGTEFPGTPQGLLNLIAAYMLITGGEDFSGVAYGTAEPAPENRGLAWFKVDGGGNPVGWYGWDGSDWIPIPNVIPSGGARPSSPTEGTQFFDTSIKVALIYYDGSWHTVDGSPGDIKFVSGTSLATVLDQNPGWSHYTDGIGKVPAGAAADGSDAETDAGADEVTLTEDQMPEHTHEDIVLTGSDADNGDAGNFVITAATASIGTRTIAASQTGPKGGSDPVDVRQQTRYLFQLIKD